MQHPGRAETIVHPSVGRGHVNNGKVTQRRERCVLGGCGAAFQSGATADHKLFMAPAPMGEQTSTMVKSGMAARTIDKISRHKIRIRSPRVSVETIRTSEAK